MQPSDVRSAVNAALSLCADVGLDADDVAIVSNSNKLAVRLLPCDVLARVVPLRWSVAILEPDLAQRLTESDGPIGRLDPRVEPRVYERDGFGVTFWTYYDGPTAENADPGEYALALAHLHETMRSFDITTPHYLDRVAGAQSLVDDPACGREFSDEVRHLLSTMLETVSAKIVRRGATEQLLHGEPHPGNVLQTTHGLLFIDLETCCRGPVEFDIAHAPEDAAAHYPGADPELLDDCRMLALALAIAWRFQPNDELPDRHRRTEEWISQLRSSVYRRNAASSERAER